MFFGEEDGLAEIYFVEVAEMFVVEVVAVSPHVEGEMGVYSDDMSEQFVEVDGVEIGEMGHVVELDEDTHDVEGVHRPAQQSQLEMDE